MTHPINVQQLCWKDCSVQVDCLQFRSQKLWQYTPAYCLHEKSILHLFYSMFSKCSNFIFCIEELKQSWTWMQVAVFKKSQSQFSVWNIYIVWIWASRASRIDCFRESSSSKFIMLLRLLSWPLVLLVFLVASVLHFTNIVQHYASRHNIFQIFWSESFLFIKHHQRLLRRSNACST